MWKLEAYLNKGFQSFKPLQSVIGCTFKCAGGFGTLRLMVLLLSGLLWEAASSMWAA